MFYNPVLAKFLDHVENDHVIRTIAAG